MKTKLIYIFAVVLLASSVPAAGQTGGVQAEKLSVRLNRVLNEMPAGEKVSAERRAQAYAKLFEAQRLIWRSGRLRSQAGIASTSRAAADRLVSAIEINPQLAEAYTALAELMIGTESADLEEAIALAEIAIKVDADNYGARRILGRLYTFKSRIASDSLDKEFADKAIETWRELTRLDPRNAEAWAFLAALYERTDRTELQIEALRKWLSSATPIETEFYARLMGGDSSLGFEDAAIKLAPALLRSGKRREAIDVLSNLIADSPDNMAAIELLREAVSDGSSEGGDSAIEALQQAVYANPQNASLIELLADVQFDSGRVDEASKLLRDSAAEFVKTSPSEAGNFLIVLGDLYKEKERFSEAIAAYEESLKIRGFNVDTPVTESDREFVMAVFERLIKTYAVADRRAEAAAVIDRARKMLGEDDVFADMQLISFYRETGRRENALAAVKAARVKQPNDFGLRRLEATLLTDLGQVDEAVVIIRNAALNDKAAVSGTGTGNPSSVSIKLPATDVFSDEIFISSLYSRAGRPKQAVAAANNAFASARSDSRKQIAKLTLATAQQAAGEFAAAEETLREILAQTPGNPIALNNLGYFLLERNERFDEAMKMIRQAVDIDPTNPSYLDSLGWAYFKLENYTEAEKYLKAALRGDPGSVAINEHLGDLYLKQGRSELAGSAWNRALTAASDPKDIARIKNKLSDSIKR